MQVGQLGTKLCVAVLVSRFWVNLSKIGGTSRRIFIDVDPHNVLFKFPLPTIIKKKIHMAKNYIKGVSLYIIVRFR